MSSAFEEWIATLRLDEPDDGGNVGEAPAGRMDFLLEVFEGHGGAVPAEVLRVAWRERERALAARAAARVEADIRRTTSLSPQVRVQTVDNGLLAVTYNGSYQTPAFFSIREPESICEVADILRDHVVDDLWTMWPICPADGLGLDPRVIDGRAVWHCRVNQHTVSDVGRLLSGTQAD